ncbi:TetR/AcrR family transcriptional regulator [Thermodesulfobacterium hydrogeniphilum]|uniref:TetR/AcrR family transcriptional regulator n=1 Tax=Thermodesulfobacterium hydrogeniphilum TaxID=161156 RepID=UPI00068EAFB0|nr:TetR/AcrR family transcriptional regulator [Thermodesulfobacterium hydrogeniphilum]
MEKLSTRDRIIEAAYTLFSEKGYHGTSTREIARAASVSEVTLFRIFGTKESLFEEVLKTKSIIPDLVAMIRDVENHSLEDLLFSLAKKFYYTLVSKKKFIMITFSEVNQYSEKIIDIYQKLIDQIDELLVKIFSKYKSTNKDFNLKIIAMAFRGMIFNLFLTNEILLRKNITKSEITHILSSYVKIILNSINR